MEKRNKMIVGCGILVVAVLFIVFYGILSFKKNWWRHKLSE
jgi:hypothetical protein